MTLRLYRYISCIAYHPTNATPSFSSCTAGQPCSVSLRVLRAQKRESSTSDGKATEKFQVGMRKHWS